MATTKGEPPPIPLLEASTSTEQGIVQRSEPGHLPETAETSRARQGHMPEHCPLQLCPHNSD